MTNSSSQYLDGHCEGKWWHSPWGRSPQDDPIGSPGLRLLPAVNTQPYLCAQWAGTKVDSGEEMWKMGWKPGMLGSCWLMSHFPQHRNPYNSCKRKRQDVAGALRKLRLCKTTSRDSRVAWTNITVICSNRFAMTKHDQQLLICFLTMRIRNYHPTHGIRTSHLYLCL